MTFVDAKNVILKKFTDSSIVVAFELDSCFVFSIRPKTWSKNDLILDAFFKVDKVSGRIHEYSPLTNPDEFKHAINNRVLYKSRR